MSEVWREKTEGTIEAELIRELGWSKQDVQNGLIQANRLGYKRFVDYLQDQLKTKKENRQQPAAPRRPIRASHTPQTGTPPPVRPLDEVLAEISQQFGKLAEPVLWKVFTDARGHTIVVYANGKIRISSFLMEWPTTADTATQE